MSTPEFEQLLEQAHDAPAIPDHVLYEWMINPQTKQYIRDEQQKLGLEEFKKLPCVTEIRRRTQRDLFWTCKYFLWPSLPAGVGKPIEQNLICKEVHGPLIDVFVKKDPNKPILEQDPLYKERVILFPRGSFKTTIDACDAVQWIVCFPDIRIVMLTAEDSLGRGFVDEVKGHFVIRPPEALGPTPMNMFFPEFCVPEKDLRGPTFTCPVWAQKQVERKEPTVMPLTIGGTLSGWHCEDLKADDMVATINSGNPDACKKVSANFYINKNIIVPNGYLEMVGTRYSEDDHYGRELVQNVGELEIKRGLDNPDDPRPWETIHNKSTGKIFIIGKGWQLKPDIEKLILENKKKEEELTEKDYFILFPNHLTFAVMRSKRRDDEPSFEGQINQNPHPRSSISFDRALLVKHTIPFNMVPTVGPIIITWDFAFSKKKGRDFTTCAVSTYNAKGQLFIIDLVRQRFTATELAKAVVDYADRYHPTILGIEKAGGSEYLDPSIRVEAENRQKPWLLSLIKGIDWFTPDQNKDAKRTRMAAMHPWLMADRLWFVSHLPYLDTLYTEFEHCLVQHHHDDIPDVIAQQLRYVTQVQIMIDKKELPTWNREDAAWNLVYGDWEGGEPDPFGRPGFHGSLPERPFEAPPDTGLKAVPSADGLPNMLGSGLIG